VTLYSGGPTDEEMSYITGRVAHHKDTKVQWMRIFWLTAIRLSYSFLYQFLALCSSCLCGEVISAA
jgi:hypothetical protein